MEMAQTPASEAVSPCDGHQEHNEKAVVCDRKWQVSRNGHRLNTEAIREGG